MNPWFFVVMVVGALLPVFAPSDNRRVARRVFWCGTLIAVMGGFLAGSSADVKTGLALAGLAAGLMLLRAYFTTPYLKFRGKIYAFSIEDSRPDSRADAPAGHPRALKAADDGSDSYGGMVTASKSWWLFVPITAVCSVVLGGYLVADRRPATWLVLMMAAVLLILAVSRGHEDGSWGYPIARQQRLQFAIVTIVTAGVFAALYLPAYYAGRRWPWRPTRSMEYRAHPRHWK
jgi:hypothetical protein